MSHPEFLDVREISLCASRDTLSTFPPALCPGTLICMGTSLLTDGDNPQRPQAVDKEGQ